MKTVNEKKKDIAQIRKYSKLQYSMSKCSFSPLEKKDLFLLVKFFYQNCSSNSAVLREYRDFASLPQGT